MLCKQAGMRSVILFVIRNGQDPMGGEGGYHLQWKRGGGVELTLDPHSKNKAPAGVGLFGGSRHPIDSSGRQAVHKAARLRHQEPVHSEDV